jgi:hypothetical protein
VGGKGVLRVFQFIASGLLGTRSFQEGWRSGALGVLLHFFIATAAAAAYYDLSRRIPFFLKRPLLGGTVFNVLRVHALCRREAFGGTLPPLRDYRSHQSAFRAHLLRGIADRSDNREREPQAAAERLLMRNSGQCRVYDVSFTSAHKK